MATERETPEKGERMIELISLANTLINEIETLADDSGKQFVSLAHRARTNRLLIIATAASVMFDLLLTVILAFVGIGWHENTNQIDTLTHRLDTQQTVQRQKALCPLYQVFLDSKSKQGRDAAPDPEKYDHAFVVIQQGYDALECDHYITHAPTAVSPGP